MFKSVINFMNQQDPNGEWLEAENTEEEKVYILETIQRWLDEDGLEINGRIQGIIEYLSSVQ